jgi:predicted lipoprotein
MAQTAIIKVVVRRGNLASWNAANPILLQGEIGFVTDAGYFIVGDGVNNFIQLAPASPATSTNRYRSEQYIVQNLINPLYSSLQSQITAESTARTNADAALNTLVTNEYTIRANADANLQAQITAEVNARVTGDANLNTYISAVEANANSAIAALETNVLTWFGSAGNNGDMLYYDASAGMFLVLPRGANGEVLTVNTATGTGVSWEPPSTGAGDMVKSVYDPDDDGVVESAEREQIAIINKTGATLTKGTIVYIKTSSSSASYPEVLKANATTEATSSKTIGAVYEDIANNDVGYIITSGQVHNLNTSAYTVGTRLWLSTVDGQVTSTPPSQPNHTVFIGFVTRSQSQNGRVLYAIQNGYELGELHDVQVQNPSINDVLYWNGLAWTKSQIDAILGYTPADSAILNNFIPYSGAALPIDLNAQSITFNDGLSVESYIDASYVRFEDSVSGSNAQVQWDKVRIVDLITFPISAMEMNAQGLKFPDNTIQSTAGEPTIAVGTITQYWRGDKTWQTLNKAAVGLSNVDNTSDANKPISSATQTALNAKENTITAGTTGQYLRGDKSWQTLDKNAVGLSNVDNTSDVNKPISNAVSSALSGKENTIAPLSPPLTDYFWRSDKTWQQIAPDVIGLDAVDNTSDLDKPISTATQTALNGKENTIVAGTTAQYWRGDKTWQTLDKNAVGLGNVDNTSDVNKPISTAVQTALNGKQGTLTLTTTGTSGAATLAGSTLNIPQYTGGGGGGGITAEESIAYAIALG